jgi:acetylglutamate kinase
MDQLIQKAKVLVEALPYIRQFQDKTVVIKYGGAAGTDADMNVSFATDVTLLRYIGIRPVIVHGGGPQIDRMLRRVGKERVFIDGQRVTDDETMEIVEMVLSGSVNSEIVANIGRAGGRAVGLTGKDCGLIRVRKLLGPEGKDLGRVGTPEHVEPALLRNMTENGFIPVVAPVGVDASGHTYNVNADNAAGAIAEALHAEKLILLTDVEGVLGPDGGLIPALTALAAREGIKSGVIKGGMIPKVECCMHALERGVTSAHIIDGRMRHALLLEIFTDGGVGTKLTAAV